MANSKIVKLFKTANHHSYLPLDAFPTSGGVRFAKGWTYEGKSTMTLYFQTKEKDV